MARNQKKLAAGITNALNLVLESTPSKVDDKTTNFIKSQNAKIADAIAASIHSYIDDARVAVENIKIAPAIPVSANGVTTTGPVTVLGQTVGQGMIDINDVKMIDESGKIK